MRRDERGALLLEAMVALAILGFVGAGAIGLTSSALGAEREMAERERALRTADRILAATSLLTRSDLDLRLGRYQIGGLTVEVQRPEPSIYRLAVSDSRSPEIELLVTLVHRPRP